jgi:hypothetical protein
MSRSHCRSLAKLKVDFPSISALYSHHVLMAPAIFITQLGQLLGLDEQTIAEQIFPVVDKMPTSSEIGNYLQVCLSRHLLISSVLHCTSATK